MAKSQNIYENLLLERLKKGDKSAFSLIFSAYYAGLVTFANTFTHQHAVSEEIVQDVFVKLWESCGVITIKTSLKSYLLGVVQNSCIDWLRHLKVRDKYAENIRENLILMENDTERYILHSELEKDFDKALEMLAEDLVVIFKMSRFEGLKQQEIADKIGVSLRTVELRLAKALIFLREQLKDYLITLIISALALVF